jgi:hypothetical protein
MFLDKNSLALIVIVLTTITLIAYLAHVRSHHTKKLWELDLAPDAGNVQRSMEQLSVAFAAYKERFGLSRLVLEIANDGRIESESFVYLIVSIAYVCILAYYIRVNPPHPQLSIDWIAAFLSTFGIVVVLGIVGAYFYFFRAFSDYQARSRLRKENGFVRRRIKYVLQSLESGKVQSTKELRAIRGELQKTTAELDLLDELLGTNVKIRLSTIVGVVGSVCALLQLLALITSSVIGLSLFSTWYVPLAISYSIAALTLLFSLPTIRSRHLLEWCQMEPAISQLRESVKQVSIDYVGKEQSDLLRKNFHLTWKPAYDD